MQKVEYGKKKSTVQINSNDVDKVKKRTDRCYTNDINNTGRVCQGEDCVFIWKLGVPGA